MKERFAESELILNADGSIYHLNLHADEIANTVITVGDPQRVSAVSRHFDKIEVQKAKREFITHTGELNGQRLTVMSTGMGPGNIDIFMNELDALANIDLSNRTLKSSATSLNIIRLGTSGSIHPDIHPGDYLVSAYAVGLDTTLTFYAANVSDQFQHFMTRHDNPNLHHYQTAADPYLNRALFKKEKRGVTLTTPGFYAAQNRSLRLPYSKNLYLNKLHTCEVEGMPFTNLEMETASIYYFAELLGHRALSLNCILANRLDGTFSKKPKADVDEMIEYALEELTTNLS